MLVTQNLGVQIYQQLRHDLMAGRYEPGQKLKLRDLAAELGVSVTPVREALARLVSDQALVQVDYRSVCVAVMDLARYAEVRELRLDLEGKAAAQAALCATEADIDTLRAIHKRLVAARAARSHAQILLENQRFHLTLCAAARMPVLLRLVEMLWLQCGPLMHGMTRWPVARLAQHPHVTIIKALQIRDGALAREAIQQDIMMATEALRLYLTSHAERPEWARRSLPADAAATDVPPPRR
ncbi:GntR family transcriptional regulator [Limobrevibacterium gyesilva]|uniref:GntR family transcriptional regulator n=1 Tax=Limobrevibacterium gyesilva TaxID=2991712 RepID=A0AA41YJM0_9PROT|nr:GntR family transcriptional regulator [Limobrevibacterium gyesilva]MCW3474906.1 GntR family transcriptional regulator [Limobrevibacterium gyesilva]